MVVFVIQHIMVAMERFLMQLIEIHQSQASLSSWNERHHRTGRPVERLLHQAAQKWHFARFLNFLWSDLPQLTAICCHRREVWTAHLARHIFSLSHVLKAQVWRAHIWRHCMRHLHALMLCVRFSATLPSSSCCLSSLLSSCSSPWLSASSSTMWWTNTLRTFANEDLGTLAQYDPLTSYEPNNYHISEPTELYIQGILGRERILELAWPSVRRLHHRHGALLHHCSPRSEKMQRAVDELITLMTNVCRS